MRRTQRHCIVCALVNACLCLGTFRLYAQAAVTDVPSVVRALCETDECAIHWINVNAQSAPTGSSQVYELYLIYGRDFTTDMPIDKWWYWTGGQYSKGARGVAIIDSSGQAVWDPFVVGQVFQRALNTCQLKMLAVGPDVGRQLNRRIAREHVGQVLDDRDGNLMIFYERFFSQLSHITQSERDYGVHSAFMTMLPILGEGSVRSAALLSVVEEASGGAIKRNQFSLMSKAVNLEYHHVMFVDYVQENLTSTAWTPEYMGDLKYWQGSTLLGKLKSAGDNIKLAEAASRIFCQKSTLEIDSPSLRRTAILLDESVPGVGRQLQRATSDSDDIAGRVIGELAKEAWDAEETHLQHTFLRVAARSKIPSAFASRLMATTLLGFEVARYSFDTSGFADAILTASAAAEVDNACRIAFYAHIGDAATFSRTSPPSIEQVDALVWLQRLQAQSGSEFYRALYEVLSTQDNLLNAVERLGYEKGKIVYDPRFDRYVDELRGRAIDNAVDATYICPSDKEGDQVLAHLLKVLRFTPQLKRNITVEPREQRVTQGEMLRFSGRVADADGRGLAEVQVTVTDPMLSRDVAGPSLLTDQTGAYQYTVSTSSVPPYGYEFTFTAPGVSEPATARVSLKPLEDQNEDQGLLDVVIAIDKSGSMSDDIQCVQRQVDTMLGEMDALAQQQNISLQVGLVLFSYTGEGNVFETCPLSADIEAARQFVAGLNAQEVGGDEDLFSALMYAMNEPVEGQQIDMGWRSGAAKITIPITDEAPKSDNFNVLQVAQVAEDLDPVHMYPLIMPKGPLGWLDSTESSLKELARVTDGQAVKVQHAGALPQAIVDAVELAIRRHKEEIYRQENPPYLLYGVAGGLGTVLLAFVAGLFIFRRRRVELQNVPPPLPIDSDLTGDTAFRQTDG